MTFFKYLKNIFFVLIILQIAPSLIQNIKKQYGKILIPKHRVGVIEMKGVLYNSDYYNKYLNKYFKDEGMKAILIKAECPGSASGTSQAIYNEIEMLKKKYPKTPIVTLVENICASGGYYVASATDYIIAPPSAIIGSIGTTFQYLFQLHDFIDQFKVKYKSLAAGKYKKTTDPFVNMTPEEEKLLQSVLNDSYEQFTIDVAKKRKLSLKNKEQWADGKIFTGNQALKLGLIDSLGSAYSAEEIIREKALIPDEEEIEWVKPPKKTGLFGLFGQDTRDEEESMFTALANKIFVFLQNKISSKTIV